MERVWTFARNAVTVTLVDFADPALAGQSDVRERGARLEVRPVRTTGSGSVYSSPTLVLEPARVRVDLLESAPRAADRMHWHPRMSDGEPGDRVFDTAMPADPGGWVRRFLADVGDSTEERAQVAGATEAVVAEVARVLEQAREPWPEVVHDERGMAPAG